ncbi:hypothetical protein A2W24_03565 [Microgenomates group bacterium RBG_16_45_19]|nr:MAG: hypothetical protein A2W24_03565 [Microgenomates group bacterium RBG_16_45_19]
MLKKLLVCLIGLMFLTMAVVPVLAQNHDWVEFFWAEGCPHCAKEKVFLTELKTKYPDLVIKSYEISQNLVNALLLQQRGRDLNADVSGVPFTIIGDEYVSGFRDNETTGKQIETRYIQVMSENAQVETPQPAGQLLNVPLLGAVNLASLSLPVLTFLIALMDGFNPCAMWTLLFLISLLLGMKDRKRMWLLGTVFIATSALVYFLFLAAWLNLFIFLGMVAWVRVGIGLVASAAGGMYLRDYYRDQSGCKVVGDEKRQKIFGKLRDITAKKQLLVALGGIMLLAVAVNLVELICSAGLPAVYTQVLSLSNLPRWQYDLYLIFYVLVFMLDDLFIFFTAMLTLKAVGIQSKYAKVSRLVGGILMIMIGVLLLFKPSWLMFG